MCAPDYAEVGVDASEICGELHKCLRHLPILGFPFEAEAIPRNGIYVLFEDREIGHGGSRVVRVGSHTEDNQLRSRLKQHFVNENKDRSIFRKNIGRCLLNRDSDPFLEFWELDLTTKAARTKCQDRVDFEKQKQIEKRVTAYMQNHLRFVVLEVPAREDRLRFESRMISTVSLCRQCGTSAEWLGRNSPKKKIRESGLWQVNELYKTPLLRKELAEFV